MANGVSFSGLGSGIDFNIIRDAIVASRSRSLGLLTSKANNYNNRIGSLRELNTGLAGLITATEGLTNRELGFGRTTNTSNATTATATASASTTIGQYGLDVTRLATNLTQTSRSYASEDTTVLAGAATTATFELRTGGSATGTAITIDNTNNTLAGLRDAINAADAGVTATIVDINGDGNTNQLVLASKETGASGRVELVETTATGTLADINISNVNPSDGNFANLDAEFSVNGLTLTRSTNVVSDAVDGVTFTLKDIGSASISVTASSEIENKLRSFVLSYNAIEGAIDTQFQKDTAGRPTGVLAGDSTLRSVSRQLRDITRIISTDNGGSLTDLTQLGITVLEDGKLELDTAVLNERLDANPEDVRSLLFGKTETDTGIFQKIESVVTGLGDSVSGTVQNAIEGYESSIKTLNSSIARRTDFITRLRDSLTRQFAIADAAIGQINGQGTALTGILKSLEPRDN